MSPSAAPPELVFPPQGPSGGNSLGEIKVFIKKKPSSNRVTAYFLQVIEREVEEKSAE
jgi:hypothetical protein